MRCTVYEKGTKMKKTQRITETAIMIALATVLSMLKIIDMPFGGTVTAFSMLPMAIIAFRHRTLWGLFAGFAYGVLQMIFGMQNLSYATSGWAVVAIIFLDYIIAFMVIGLAGIFRGKIKDSGISLATGTLLACALRYVCHVISGCTVWAGVSIPTSDGLIYSLVYNAAYMIPETLLTVSAAYYAGKAFNLTSDSIKRIPLENGITANLYASIPVVLAVVIDFVMIFGMTQTEEGFDISALTSADIFSWITVIAIFVIGIVATICIRTFSKGKTAKAAE